MLSISEVATLFAGWVTARIVSDHRAGHAILMATLGLASAMLVGAIRWGAAPSWYYITSWVLMPFMALIGARAWERSLRRRNREAAPRVAVSR